jgi:hypothetical protein
VASLRLIAAIATLARAALSPCARSLPDGIVRATEAMVSGELGLNCGYSDIGKGCDFIQVALLSLQAALPVGG